MVMKVDTTTPVTRDPAAFRVTLCCPPPSCITLVYNGKAQTKRRMNIEANRPRQGVPTTTGEA